MALFAVAPAQAAKAPSKPVRSVDAFQQEQAMSPAQLIARWKPLVTKAASRVDIPVAWINAVMRVESGGRTMLTQTQPMVSNKGAIGLMQVLPQTYQDMRAQYRLGPSAFDPKDNINAGAGYLHWLRGKYGFPTMFAAYNAGPGQVDDVLTGTKKLPAETRAYVARVTAILGKAGDGAAIDSVKLTRPDGTPVQIDPLAVSAIRAPLPDEYPANVLTVIAMGRLSQAVTQELDATRAAIRIRGGKV
jgi:soluble lytic murein transglycosylase-like protein